MTKEGNKKDDTYLPPSNVFGGVLVVPHSDRYIIVDVQVAGPIGEAHVNTITMMCGSQARVVLMT